MSKQDLFFQIKEVTYEAHVNPLPLRDERSTPRTSQRLINRDLTCYTSIRVLRIFLLQDNKNHLDLLPSTNLDNHGHTLWTWNEVSVSNLLVTSEPRILSTSKFIKSFFFSEFSIPSFFKEPYESFHAKYSMIYATQFWKRSCDPERLEIIRLTTWIRFFSATWSHESHAWRLFPLCSSLYFWNVHEKWIQKVPDLHVFLLLRILDETLSQKK